jgi:hypothetical protein
LGARISQRKASSGEHFEIIKKSNRSSFWDEYLQIQKSVSNKMEINMKLEQDEMEGVDSKEWVSGISISFLALT